MLTGPYRAITAYGSFTIEVDITTAPKEVVEWHWDCKDEFDSPVTRTIQTRSSNRNIEVTYMVLSDAAELHVQVYLRLPSDRAPKTGNGVVYGKITICSEAFQGYEYGERSVLFDSMHKGVQLIPDSSRNDCMARLPLARSVLAVPLGWLLDIEMSLYDELPDQQGTVKPIFQSQDLWLDLENYEDRKWNSSFGNNGKVEVKITSPDIDFWEELNFVPPKPTYGGCERNLL